MESALFNHQQMYLNVLVEPKLEFGKKQIMVWTASDMY